MATPDQRFSVNKSLVHKLVVSQFPKWKHLLIRPVTASGWDNHTFHLGNQMLVRLPSAAQYAAQVEKEHKWLPKLASSLSLSIPTPIELGVPMHGYPWKWSIYNWLEGTSLADEKVENLSLVAKQLAKFLTSLEKVNTEGGPHPGLHNFYRGSSPAYYDSEVQLALKYLKGKINVQLAAEIWKKGIASYWKETAVWVHGDISAGNLLVYQGNLSAVIDFGQLSIGDPACDLAIAWTLFKGESRAIFKEALPYSEGTWSRARSWALWKSLIVAAGLTNPNNFESSRAWIIIEEILNKSS